MTYTPEEALMLYGVLSTYGEDLDVEADKYGRTAGYTDLLDRVDALLTKLQTNLKEDN